MTASRSAADPAPDSSSSTIGPIVRRADAPAPPLVGLDETLDRGAPLLQRGTDDVDAALYRTLQSRQRDPGDR
ncbi:hypothetical protein [Gordonia sp. WA4-43]|uniref:hypothetical protein n=1 Tax=Gordonia sp. WA4-43 TaxID=2878678 RepID=UPI00299ED706|nr:hypothetical protein [Gordonia sp. WA4-43]